MSRHIFGLDIGSAAIKGAVWRTERKGMGRLAAYSEVPSEGVKRGVVQGIEAVAASCARLAEDLERVSGVELERAIVGIGGVHLENRLSKGTAIVSRADKMVTEEDVNRVLELSKSYAAIPNRQALHIIPRSFALDGVGGLRNPAGMEGYHLDVESYVIDGLTPAIRFLERTLDLAGIEREMMVATPLAGARAALTKRDCDVGSVAIDIGGATTSLAVFEDDMLMHIAVLPIGSMHVTNDIALALKIPIEAAEAIKIEVGSVIPQQFDKRDYVTLSRYIEGANENVSKRYIAEIISARVEEILEFVANELKKIDRLGKLAGGTVIFGGGAKLRGIEALAKKEFRMPSRIATMDHLAQFFRESCDLQFVSVCGLILWCLEERGEHGGLLRGAGIWERFKNLVNFFLP